MPEIPAPPPSGGTETPPADEIRPEDQDILDMLEARSNEPRLLYEDVSDISVTEQVMKDFNSGKKAREKARAALYEERSKASWSSRSSNFLGEKLGKFFKTPQEKYKKLQKDFYCGDDKDPLLDAKYRMGWGFGMFILSPLLGPIMGPFAGMKGIKDGFTAFTEYRFRMKDMKGDNNFNPDLVKYTQAKIEESLRSTLTTLEGKLASKAITPDDYHQLVSFAIKEHNTWMENELFPRERALTEAQNELHRRLGRSAAWATGIGLLYGGGNVSNLSPLLPVAAALTAMHANAELHNVHALVPKEGEDTADYLLKNPFPFATPDEMADDIAEKNRQPIEIADFSTRARDVRQPLPTQRFTAGYPELAPTDRVEHEGRFYYTGPTFSDSTGETFSVFYVQDGKGKLLTRLAHRDRLNGIWRVVEGINFQQNSSKKKKGSGPTAAYMLPKSSIHQTQDGLLPTNVSEALEGTNRKQEPIESLTQDAIKKLLRDYFAKEVIKEDRDGVERPKPAIEPTSYVKEVRRFSDGGVLDVLRLTKPDNLTLLDPEFPAKGGVPRSLGLKGFITEANRVAKLPGFVPDFTQSPFETYGRTHPFLGDVILEVYKGELASKSVLWHMAHDDQGRIWVDRLELQEAAPTSYGVPAQVVDAGILTLQPLVDKDKGRYDLIKSYTRKVKDARETVLDVTEFLDELAPISLYRAHRSIKRTTPERNDDDSEGVVDEKGEKKDKKEKKNKKDNTGKEGESGKASTEPDQKSRSDERFLEGLSGKKLYRALMDLPTNKEYEKRYILQRRMRAMSTQLRGSYEQRGDGKLAGLSRELYEEASAVQGLSLSNPTCSSVVQNIESLLEDEVQVATFFGLTYRQNQIRRPEMRQALILRGIDEFLRGAKRVRHNLVPNSAVRNAYHAIAIQLEELQNMYQRDGAQVPDTAAGLVQDVLTIRVGLEKTRKVTMRNEQSNQSLTPVAANAKKPVNEPKQPTEPTPPPTPTKPIEKPPTNPQVQPEPKPQIETSNSYQQSLPENPLDQAALTNPEKKLRDKIGLAAGALSSNVPTYIANAQEISDLQDMCAKLTKRDDYRPEGAGLVRLLRVIALGFASVDQTKRVVGVHDAIVRYVLERANYVESTLSTDPTGQGTRAQSEHGPLESD